MSEEVKETEHQMYVQQIDWDMFKSLVTRVTNVYTVYMYNMPNKAAKYKDDIVNLIKTLDSYLSGDDDWRVSDEKNAPFKYDKGNDKVMVGNWVLDEPQLILCIPKLNSFFIIPSDTSTYKGSVSPTHIIQLSNCISVMPMVLSMREVPDQEKDGVINIAMVYEMINPPTDDGEEKPAE